MKDGFYWARQKVRGAKWTVVRVLNDYVAFIGFPDWADANTEAQYLQFIGPFYVDDVEVERADRELGVVSI